MRNKIMSLQDVYIPEIEIYKRRLVKELMSKFRTLKVS